MRLARHGQPGRERPIVAGPDGAWRDLSPLTKDVDSEFLASGFDALHDAMAKGSLALVETPIERFGPPLARVGKIVCIGLNYLDHARETGAAIPDEPIMFLKTSDTVVGPDDTVLIPRKSVKTDWEVELAVVIGRPARYLSSPSEALACVAGYAISNDVSEREFQIERGGQWDKGKNCETFNPLGPWLVDAASIGDPQNLAMRLSVNGVLRQDSNTSNMIFSVAHLVWYLSQFLVLHPGDVINTGTPHGVALGLPDHPYLRAGDVVELEIEGLGSQRQTFEAA
ncbi:MAG: fumarylacetoacetate hydrolase family protein [Acidimicrobiales bacterium]|jgi:2-keto-4-pentenoate hydratase/2-oxohepta-3-ene-1,7-dioic acid hydratase in catechol pathway